MTVNQVSKIQFLLVAGACALAGWTDLARGDDALPNWSWWPAQNLPKALVQVSPDPQDHDKISRFTHEVLAESLAGLAARGVNENHFDELVWVGAYHRSSDSYTQWFQDFKMRTHVDDRGSVAAWDLAAQLTKAGLVKGYIIYAPDTSTEHELTKRTKQDESLNVATTAAGVLDGILITPEMEAQAKALGLTLLLDARGKTDAWAFAQYKDQLNRGYLLLQDSRLAENRDIAIAHHIAALYTIESPYPEILAWMKPLGTVFGWYGDSEEGSVGLASKAGMIVVASDYTRNLPVLSAGRAGFTPAPPADIPVDAAKIEKDAAGSTMAYLISDGDNLQWLMGDFITHPKFWANPDRDKVPFGWALCPGDLDLMAPDALAFLWRTKPADASFVAHGGYYYPDLFAQNFPADQRRDLLHQLAHRIGAMMAATHMHLLTFISMKLDTDAAREAYAIFAQEIPDLTGVFAIAYDPYEDGGGTIYWEPDGKGGEVPFITARYSLWADVKKRPRAGTPAYVAQVINTDAKAATKSAPLTDWILVHAWSGFLLDEDPAKGSGVPNNLTKVALIGPSAAALCTAKLSPDISVVNPEELAWITRWHHDPEKTRALLGSQK